MSLETSIQSIVSSICPRSFPDFAPFGTVAPYITWNQAGGSADSYVGNEVPSNRNARIQISVWAKTRAEANSIALQIESAMIQATTISARPKGAFVSTYDATAELRGAMQDFTVWADR